MKGFKKIALVAAISAAPFAQAELTSIDDAMLSEMTGQAGITIELDTAISIGSLVYSDTDGLAATKGGSGLQGDLTVSNIQFGGSTVATGVAGNERFDEILIDIDVDAGGGIVVHLGGTNTPGVIDGTASVDFGLHLDGITSSGMTGNLVGSTNIAGRLGPVDVTINNTSGGDLIDVKAYFEVQSGNLNVPVAGLNITDLKVGQDLNPISNGGLVTTAAPYATAISDLITATASADDSGVDNMAFAHLTVGTATVNFFNTGTSAADSVSNALEITLVDLNLDVSMGVELGGRSIGTVALNDLDLSGTKLAIFGH